MTKSASSTSMHSGEGVSDYVGHDELLVLEQAVNYNQHIAARFAQVRTRYGDASRRPPTVLDFGAGIGTISCRFRDTTGISPLAIELDARQRSVLRTRGLEAVAGLDDVPDESVDFVFSSNVMEHIEDDVSALRAIHASLRPGGVVALWIPAFPVLWTSLDDRVEHFRRYTRKSADAALRTAGFSNIPLCIYQDSVGFGLALLFKFVGTKNGTLDPRLVRLFDRWLFPISQVLDGVCSRVFGKNVFIVGVKQ